MYVIFFVNVCKCCHCSSVTLLEFSVTSVIRRGTRWAVWSLVCVIRPLSLQCYPTCLPPGGSQTPRVYLHWWSLAGSKYSNFRPKSSRPETITVNRKKPNPGCFICISVTWRTHKKLKKWSLKTHWWNPCLPEAGWLGVMAARGWSNRDLVTRSSHSPGALSILLSLVKVQGPDNARLLLRHGENKALKVFEKKTLGMSKIP